MKLKILTYVAISSILLVLFQYMNSKRAVEDFQYKLEKCNQITKQYKDSISFLSDKMMDLSHFNLERNEDALSYFENDGHDVSTLIPLIKDEIYKLNELKGEHPIIPYASGEGRKMMLNTVKLLNHKWVIADFSDGEFWGEVFLTYEINSNKEIKFNLVESFLYPFD